MTSASSPSCLSRTASTIRSASKVRGMGLRAERKVQRMPAFRNMTASAAPTLPEPRMKMLTDRCPLTLRVEPTGANVLQHRRGHEAPDEGLVARGQRFADLAGIGTATVRRILNMTALSVVEAGAARDRA